MCCCIWSLKWETEAPSFGDPAKTCYFFLASLYLFTWVIDVFFSFSFPFMQGDVVGGVNVKRIITNLPGIHFIKGKWHFSK